MFIGSILNSKPPISHAAMHCNDPSQSWLGGEKYTKLVFGRPLKPFFPTYESEDCYQSWVLCAGEPMHIKGGGISRRLLLRRIHTGEASKGSSLSGQSTSDHRLQTQNFPQQLATLWVMHGNSSPRLAIYILH